jgi:hypothetical protein
VVRGVERTDGECVRGSGLEDAKRAQEVGGVDAGARRAEHNITVGHDSIDERRVVGDRIPRDGSEDAVIQDGTQVDRRRRRCCVDRGRELDR